VEPIQTDALRLRRAEEADVPFLLSLTSHEEVEPFMSAGRAQDAESVLAEVRRSAAEPQEFGRLVIEVRDRERWARAGALGFECSNRRSRIASLGGLAIHPDFQGRGIADEAARLFQRYLLFELGYHRLQLECYGFNERAIRHAERVGFVREGVKRKAYWRHDEWVDGVMFALLADDLDDQPSRTTGGPQ
jgi:RimJ/RimL family protein N-acetyltransferase